MINPDDLCQQCRLKAKYHVTTAPGGGVGHAFVEPARAEGEGELDPILHPAGHTPAVIACPCGWRRDAAAAPQAEVPRGHCERCDRCGWLFGAELGKCRLDDCSMRPLPARRDTCPGCGAPFIGTSPATQAESAAHAFVPPTTFPTVGYLLCAFPGCGLRSVAPVHLPAAQPDPDAAVRAIVDKFGGVYSATSSMSQAVREALRIGRDEEREACLRFAEQVKRADYNKDWQESADAVIEGIASRGSVPK